MRASNLTMEVAEPPVKIQFGLTQFLYSCTFVNNWERNSMAQTRRQYAFEKKNNFIATLCFLEKSTYYCYPWNQKTKGWERWWEHIDLHFTFFQEEETHKSARHFEQLFSHNLSNYYYSQGAALSLVVAHNQRVPLCWAEKRKEIIF